MTTSIESTWLRRFHEAPGAAVRLLCFPHAGGAATYFFGFSKTLAPTVDVAAVQYPGRQDRRAEPFVDDIATLAAHVVAELPDDSRPLALFGHSMGATIAYEVARLLEKAGTPPLGLFASGRRSPSSTRDEWVHRRDDPGLVAALRELSGTDSALLADEEILRMVLPALRADYRAVETYRHAPGVEPSCPVTVLVGDSDPVTSGAEAAAWRDHTTGVCQVRTFSGGHFYLDAQADAVCQAISDSLETWFPLQGKMV